MNLDTAPRSVDDVTVDWLWEQYRELMIPVDLDPDNFVLQRCREAFAGGALFTAAVLHAMHREPAFSEIERLTTVARLHSEAQQTVDTLVLPEALRSMKQ